MQAYRIVDWIRLYEVDSEGHATRPHEMPLPRKKLRKSPLPYIRHVNTGHSQTPMDRKINQKAWRQGELFEAAVHGLKAKLLNIAGNQPRDFRGWILDERQVPLNAAEIADILGWFDVGRVREGLGILTDPETGFLEVCEFRRTCADLRKSPETCALFKEETETEGEGKLNEERGADNLSGLSSDCSTDFSDSDSKAHQKAHLQIAEARAKALKEVLRLLRVNPANQSDITTFRDIFDQLEGRIIAGELTTEIFDVVIDEAVEAAGHRLGKIGRFVNAMKLPRFGYVPVKKQVFGSRYK